MVLKDYQIFCSLHHIPEKRSDVRVKGQPEVQKACGGRCPALSAVSPWEWGAL